MNAQVHDRCPRCGGELAEERVSDKPDVNAIPSGAIEVEKPETVIRCSRCGHTPEDEEPTRKDAEEPTGPGPV